jgi:hypothetical protein
MHRYRFLTTLLLLGLLLSCEPERGYESIPEEPTPEEPTPDEPTPEEPTPEEPAPEEPIYPENPLSTLEGDVEVVFSADNSLSYADCFGNYYHTDSYMWGLYFQNYTSKEQLYIEIMHPEHILEIPLGTYRASDDIYATEVLIKGGFDEDGYQAYSWYTRLETDTHNSATAPIFDGSITIEEIDEELFRVSFDLIDDKGNRITGSYEGRMILEDFRI